MALKVLGSWDYTPKFAGNKNMTIVFKRLSGAEELGVVAEYKEASERGAALLVASIVEIRRPMTLELPDSSQREMTAQDIVDIPELKDLFYELLAEHSSKTKASEEALKKQK